MPILERHSDTFVSEEKKKNSSYLGVYTVIKQCET